MIRSDVDTKLDLLIVLVAFDSESNTRSKIFEIEQLLGDPRVPDNIAAVVWDNRAHQLPIGDDASVVYLSSSSGNIGFGAAINAVAGIYSHRRLLLLNPDIHLDADQFTAMLQTVLDLRDDIVWAPTLLNANGSAQTWTGSLFMRTPMQEVWDMLGFPAKFSRRVPPLYYLRGAVLSISSALFDSVGGFDERYFLYGEEADLCFRLSGMGELIVDPAIRVVHEGSQGFLGKSNAALRSSLRARAVLHGTYSSRAAAMLVRGVGASVYRLQVIKRRLSTRAS